MTTPIGMATADFVALRCAVAYVKYERASCAAGAMEALHETVLGDGRTRLKVLLAEAPTARRDEWVILIAALIFVCTTLHWSSTAAVHT